MRKLTLEEKVKETFSWEICSASCRLHRCGAPRVDRFALVVLPNIGGREQQDMMG